MRSKMRSSLIQVCRVALVFVCFSCSVPTIAQIKDDYAKVSADLTLHYQLAGHGDIAIVFVPGWTMTTRAFEHQMEHFANSTKFQALVYDPRAQGLSTITTEGHNYPQHARDLYSLLNMLGIRHCLLVGWSAGGGDVLEYVRLFGADRLAGLVLIDTSPLTRTKDYTKQWAWFGTKEDGDQDGYLKFFSYDVMLDRKKVNSDFAKWMLDDPSPSNIEFIEEMSNHTPDSIAALLNTSYWFLDDVPTIKSLNGKIPLLYITRADWHHLAADWSKRNTPAATVVSFGKHMMFWEHPERFNSVLDNFLTAVR